MKHAFSSTDNTIKAFAAGNDHGHNTGSSVFFEGGILYSWGTHFPMAIRMPGKDNLKTGKDWILLNGDKYSSSTAQHIGCTYSYFPDSPRVSMSGIRSAGFGDPYYLKSVRLVDFSNDYYKTAYKGQDNDKTYPNEIRFAEFEKKVPMGSEITYRRDDNGNITEKIAHRIGSVVLRFKNKDYLCSMDGSSYFVSLLPHKVKSVNKAFESLKPEIIQQLQKNKIEIRRQGEWFLFKFDDISREVIPKYLAKILSKMTLKRDNYKSFLVLPKKDSNGHDHILTRGMMINNYPVGFGILKHGQYVSPKVIRSYSVDAKTQQLIVTDRIRKQSTLSSGQHKIVRLGNKALWVCVMNTSKRDWSVEGEID